MDYQDDPIQNRKQYVIHRKWIKKFRKEASRVKKRIKRDSYADSDQRLWDETLLASNESLINMLEVDGMTYRKIVKQSKIKKFKISEVTPEQIAEIQKLIELGGFYKGGTWVNAES